MFSRKSKANKKVANATAVRIDGIGFKSKLEANTYLLLKNAGMRPEYESQKITLVEGFKPSVSFYDKDKKTGSLKENKKKILPITYTPDFYFIYNKIHIFVECKGFENDVFPLKKKLFRKWLETQTDTSMYFEVFNLKEVNELIKIIQNEKKH